MWGMWLPILVATQSERKKSGAEGSKPIAVPRTVSVSQSDNRAMGGLVGDGLPAPVFTFLDEVFLNSQQALSSFEVGRRPERMWYTRTEHCRSPHHRRRSQMARDCATEMGYLRQSFPGLLGY